MRQNEFRAKSMQGDWMYGYYAQCIESANLRGIIMPLGKNISEVCEVRPDTVGQLLGIVNGIKIYNGDILKCKDTFENSHEHQFVRVAWNDTELSYELQKINGIGNVPLNWIKNFDLVGNDVDNAELLL